MKKRIGLILIALVLALCLTSCSSPKEPEPAAAPAPAENTAPAITGVADQTVEAGSEVDLLAGVSAADAEDGDLTGMITIDSTPSLAFKNGKATPETAGDYELVFSVTDQGGETAEAYATLTVTKRITTAGKRRSTRMSRKRPQN